jgi:MFS family permease
VGRLRVIGSVFALAVRNRQLRWLELAFAAFNGAEWAVWLALLVYAYGHGGASAAALMAVVQLVPSALLSPALASLADRHRPGRVLMAAYLAEAATMAIVALAIEVSAPTLVVFVLAPLMNLTISVPRPATAALLPGVCAEPVELAAANVVSGWAESGSVLVAPALAGVLLGSGGPELAIAAMALVAALAAALVAPLPGPPPIPPQAADGSGGLFADTAESVREIAHDPPARLLVAVLGAQFVLVGALDLLYVVLAIDVLDMGESGAGYLNAAFGAGGLIGGVVAAAVIGHRHLAPVLISGILAAATALALLGIHPGQAAAFAMLTVAGLGRAVFDVTGRTLLQRVAPPDMLARVFGLLESLMDSGLALGSLLVPLLIAISGPRAALIGAGGLLALGVLATGRRLLAVDEAADVPVVEINLLRTMPLFAPLPAPALETLGRSLERMRAEPGTVLIREGDPGDRFYAIADGQVEVSHAGTVLATLGRGHGVGEIALLHEVPRTATVTVTSSALLYALAKQPFLLALTNHPPAGQAAHYLARERLGELADAP